MLYYFLKTHFRLAKIAFIKEDNWNHVKQSRKEYLRTFTSTSTCQNDLISEDDISALVSSIEEKLGLESDSAIHEKITEKSLLTASEMLAYLSFCPPEVEVDAARLEVDKSVKIYSPKEILIILSRFLHAEARNIPYQDAFSKFLNRIREAWHLHYGDIKKLTSGKQCEDCKVSETFLENPILATTTNHPVHIFNENHNPSPSAFIPFCWFGDNEKFSIKNEKFNVPVCNSFKPKLRNDQVCYELDPNELLEDGQSANNIALYLMIDENKDRQILDSIEVSQNQSIGIEKEKENFMVDFGNEKETFIYLDTIGNICFSVTNLTSIYTL